VSGNFLSRLFGPPEAPPDRSAALENFRRVRGLEIRTRKLVNEVFSGEYHSVFRGRGIEFAEVREYQPGDDVRSIDWNVTARTGRPFVKQYQEERELTVVFAVDVSGSLGFGTRGSLKAELAAELCAVLAMSAVQNHDKLGLMLFSDRVDLFLRPRKGRPHVMRIIREVLEARSTGRATRMEDPLEQLRRVLKRKAVIFVVSDFLGHVPVRQLALLNRRHDVIALRLQDTAEVELPSVGLVELVDAETGKRALVDTGSRGLRRRYRERQAARLQEVKSQLARARVETVTLTTGESFVRPLMDFFEKRAR
jgi:uncharacterized protein (DUF58 family)